MFKRIGEWWARRKAIKLARKALRHEIVDKPPEETAEQKIARKRRAREAMRQYIGLLNSTPEAKHEAKMRQRKFETAKPMPGVVPKDKIKDVMALDSTPYQQLNSGFFNWEYMFPGYGYLAELCQIAEYRKMDMRLPADMVRKFIEVKAKGEGKKQAEWTDKINEMY
jgi:hypothetical protein